MLVFSVRFVFLLLLLYVFDNNFFRFIEFKYWFLELLLFVFIFSVGDYFITRCLGGES